MAAIGCDARSRWREIYRTKHGHDHAGRAEAWQLILLALVLFWGAVGYGISALT